MGSGKSKDSKIHQEINVAQTQISSPTASCKNENSVTEKNAITSSEYRQAITLIQGNKIEEALIELNQIDEKYPISADVQFWKAISHLALRDLSKAQEYCELAIKIDSKHKRALAELGNIQILTHKYEDAYKTFSDLMQIDEKSFDAHMGLGYVRMHVDDFNTAKQHYETAMDQGQDKIAILNYGHMLVKQKNYEMALQFYMRAIEIDKDFLQGILAIGNLYLIQEKYQELLNFCDKKMKHENWKLDCLSLKSQAYFGMKYFEESQKHCEKILEFDPQNIDALYGIAMSQKGRHLYQQSQKTITKILEIDPKHMKSLRLRAKMYIYMKCPQQVIDCCEIIFEIDPKDSVTFYYRAQAYVLLKAFGKAIEDFEKAINFELNPSYNLDVYRCKAKCHLEFKQYKELQNCYDYMIALTNNTSEKVSLYIEKGKYFIKQKQLDHANQSFIKAAKLEQNSLEIQLRIANVYRDNEQFKLAIQNYDKIINQNPKFIKAYLEKSILLEMQQNYQEVINHCNKALSYQDNCVEALILRGKAKLQLQLYNDAARDFARVIELQRSNHQAYFELGSLYYIQSDFEKASEYFQKAVELAPEIEVYHTKRALALSLQEFDREAIQYLSDAITKYPHFEDCKHLMETLQSKPKHVREYTNAFVFIIVSFFDLAEQLSTSQAELVSDVKCDFILEILNSKLRENFPNIKNFFEIIRYFILNKFDCRIFVGSEEFVKIIYEIYQEKYENENLTKQQFVTDMIELSKKIAKLKDKQLQGQQKGQDKVFYQDFLKVIPDYKFGIFQTKTAGFAVKDAISVITFLMINSNKIKIEQKNLKTILFSITKNGFLEKLKLK